MRSRIGLVSGVIISASWHRCVLEHVLFRHVLTLVPGGQGEALVRSQWTSRSWDIGVSGTAGLILTGGIEASTVDTPTDFLFQPSGGAVRAVY